MQKPKVKAPHKSIKIPLPRMRDTLRRGRRPREKQALRAGAGKQII